LDIRLNNCKIKTLPLHWMELTCILFFTCNRAF